MAPPPLDDDRDQSDDLGRCLQVDVDGRDVDVVSGLLWQGGVSGIHELDLGAGRTRLIAGFAAAAESDLLDLLGDRWSPDVFDARHDGWLDAWRPFARPVRVGTVVVHPPWEPPPWPDLQLGTDDLVVPIDPGRAFGQGNHPTTRLVLARLQRLVTDARAGTVLDVGCGSGVLAVVAARLGADPVVAVDVEDAAARATAENAERNGVAAQIEVTTTPLEHVVGRFDLVLANILAPILIDLADCLVTHVGERGTLVLSGMLESQVEGVRAALGSELAVVGTASLEGWADLVLECR